MYQYVTQVGESFTDALAKAKARYPGFECMRHRTISTGGFLGFGAKESVEVEGYVRHDVLAQEKARIEDEKKRILAMAKERQSKEEKGDENLQKVLTEVKALRDKLDQIPQSHPGAVLQHPTLDKLEEILETNGFSRPYRKMILDRCRKDFSLAALENFEEVEAQVLQWILATIVLYQEKPVQGPRIFILVGPTGVGKTTTIAKLAALYGGLSPEAHQRLKVSMISIDNYRIGAKGQIESYGEIMGFPVACVENFDALKQRIAQESDRDLILVDTIGKSPKDFMKLAEMRKLLEACGKNAEFHLAISAITKNQDIQEIFAQFEPFGYRSVVVTKLDETTAVGNLISLLWERGKSLSFMTTGQGVPQDIKRANPLGLMEGLVGFSAAGLNSLKAQQKEVNHG